MQNSNSIYEIAKLVKDKNYIQNDISQAIQLVSDFFKNKYITSLESEIKIQTADIKTNPTKELKLLYLLKEFLPEKSHSDIDNLINTLTTVSAITSIQKKLIPENTSTQSQIIKTTSADPSVKIDGVYDIDENCKISTQTTSSFNFSSMLGIIFLIAVLSDFNK